MTAPVFDRNGKRLATHDLVQLQDRGATVVATIVEILGQVCRVSFHHPSGEARVRKLRGDQLTKVPGRQEPLLGGGPSGMRRARP